MIPSVEMRKIVLSGLCISVQVFCGFFVLNYLVWMRERQARMTFLIIECRKENVVPPDNAQVLGVSLIVHTLVFVTLFGAVWRFWGTWMLCPGHGFCVS